MTDFSDFLIASDLDGTFLWDGRISARNLEALERFRKGGGIFTLATGRAHLNLRSAIGQPTTLINAPVICDNGAYLYDFETGESLCQDLLHKEDAQALLAFAKAYFPNVRFSAVGTSCIRTESDAGCVARDLLTYDKDAICVAPAEEWATDDWYKFLFLNDDPACLEGVCEKALAHFGDRFTPTCSSNWILELQYPHVSKALGIQKLKKCLNGAKKRTVIACGDYENDIRMLQVADVAVAPENALDRVKEVADLVLCHCKDGLIADVIEAIEKGQIRPHGR